MNDSPADDADPHAAMPTRRLRVITGSRVHFGLLHTSPPFGGVGAMIDHPATEIVIENDVEFRCDDSSRTRVLAIAQRVAALARLSELPACRVQIIARPATHSGLGSGTQLAMATAEALCDFVGQKIEPVTLARRIADRGERSAVGIHGYFQGGLIYESADQPCELNPLRQRIELPGDWCVALFRPRQSTTLVSGDIEREQFSRLAAVDPGLRNELQSIITTQMMPAAQASDFDSFSSAVGRYNHQSGLLFASVQGGAYNGEWISGLIRSLVDRGVQGVGQSSWGPSVFAWFESREQADEFVGNLPPDFAKSSISKPRNRGRSVSREY